MKKETPESTQFIVKATPGASFPGPTTWDGKRLAVRLKSPPQKGLANKELIEILSDLLSCPRSSITILQGKNSGIKRVRITGIPFSKVDALLLAAIPRK